MSKEEKVQTRSRLWWSIRQG